MAKPDFEPLIGGCGGVYLLAEPGELVVEVVKRDRNARNTISELRAILAGPDRRVLAEEFIPDDGAEVGGGLGPPATATLRAQVERAGIYALNITVSQDRYGNNAIWGFRTNCPRYLIETARGHRDERHQEPIVLESPDTPGVVCFHPRAGEFAIELSRLPADAGPVEVHAGDGALLGTLTPDADGNASVTVPADEHRDAVPWELRVPAMQATINADGLTRWGEGDPIVNACYWSPDPESWFPFIESRWLLTPYQRTVYGDPGAEGAIELQVHNNAPVEREFALSLEFPDGEWPVEVALARVTLDARASAPVSVRYAVPAGAGPHLCHVRVTPADTPEVTTYSTLIARVGEAPAIGLLEMPIELRPYEHENEQFGYLPDYALDNQVYFDRENRPFVVAGSRLYREVDERAKYVPPTGE